VDLIPNLNHSSITYSNLKKTQQASDETSLHEPPIHQKKKIKITNLTNKTSK